MLIFKAIQGELDVFRWKKDSVLRENNCPRTESVLRSVQFSEIEARKCELQGTNYAQGQIVIAK